MKQFILVCLAIATEFAWANEFYLDDDEFEVEDEDVSDRRQLGVLNRGYFRNNKAYKESTKEEKLWKIWKMLVPDSSVVQTPMEYYWKEFDDFFTQVANTSFCSQWDELDPMRQKTTHTQGVVAKVEWRRVDNPEMITYSGLYGSGSHHVIMRLSETRNLTSASTGLLPGIAFKFLVDDIRSENLFAMPNLTGIDEEGNTSWDFFHRPLSNRVQRFADSCERETVEMKFREVTTRPYATAISFAGTRQLDGLMVPVEAIKIPYQLEYIGMHNFPDNSDETWYDRMKGQFQKTDKIMEVHAWTAPKALDGVLVHIADIILKSDLYTSRGGDERLFFQHKRVSNDRIFWPREWKRLNEDVKLSRDVGEFSGIANWPTTDNLAEEFYISEVTSSSGCPFAWLLQ